jgi:hypothetical protein
MYYTRANEVLGSVKDEFLDEWSPIGKLSRSRLSR